jgi:hypothetical protein
MRNFALGVIAGIIIAVCGYKPYQIESEYRHNIAAGLGAPSSESYHTPHCMVTIFRHDFSLSDGTPVEIGPEQPPIHPQKADDKKAN